jgi:hypothetical protein
MARPYGWVTSDGTVVIKQETYERWRAGRTKRPQIPRVIHMGTITAEVQQTCGQCQQPFYFSDGHVCRYTKDGGK